MNKLIVSALVAGFMGASVFAQETPAPTEKTKETTTKVTHEKKTMHKHGDKKMDKMDKKDAAPAAGESHE